jgi:hypothetical protein
MIIDEFKCIIKKDKENFLNRQKIIYNKKKIFT